MTPETPQRVLEVLTSSKLSVAGPTEAITSTVTSAGGTAIIAPPPVRRHMCGPAPIKECRER